MTQLSPVHEPQPHAPRPKGILKNPSFTAPSTDLHPVDSNPVDPVEAKELTHQNTLQNAGHRRSSSAARKQSQSRRTSSIAGLQNSSSSSDHSAVEDDPSINKLKWDEANLYLAEQEAGGRMKITEPKTPFQHGNAMEEVEREERDEEEDVAIDPRFVDVDEVDLKRRKESESLASGSNVSDMNSSAAAVKGRKARESEIPGLELGDAEDEGMGIEDESARLVKSTSGNLNREGSRDKHVDMVAEDEQERLPGTMTREEELKHKMFEDKRKQHYEMRNVRDMLGQNLEEDEDEDTAMTEPTVSRSVNGTS